MCWGYGVAEATDGAQAQHLDGHPALRFAGPYSSVVSGAGIGFCAVTIAGEGECRGGWPPFARVAGPFEDAPTRATSVPVGDPPVRYSGIGASRSHACALTDAGRAVCATDSLSESWNGTLTVMNPPDPAPGRYTAIGVGFGHACALTDSGEAVCWDDRTKQVGASRSAAGAVRGRERRPVPHLRADRCRRGGLLGVEQPRTGRRARGALHGDRRRLDAHLRVDRCRRGYLLGSGRRGGHTPRPPRGDQRGLLGRLRPGSRRRGRLLGIRCRRDWSTLRSLLGDQRGQ